MTAIFRRSFNVWPLPEPGNWLQLVNQPQAEAEVQAIRRSIHRGRPFGGDAWVQRTAESPGLKSTLHARGRPRITPDP
jgi:putative transposase